MNISHRDMKIPEQNLLFGRHPFSASMVKGVCFLLDSAAILCAGLVSYLSIVGFSETNIDIYMFAILFLWIANFMLFHYGELYKFEAVMEPLRSFDKFVVAYVIAFMMFLAVAFSLKVSASYSRIWMYTFAISGGAAIFALRTCASLFVKKLSKMGLFVRNVVVVGDGEQASRMLNFLDESGPDFLSVLGVFDAQEKSCTNRISGFSTIGGLTDLVIFVRTNNVDDVIVALPWDAEDRILSVVEQLRELPVNIYLSSDLAGFSLAFRPSPSHYSDLPMVEVVDKPISDWSLIFKFAMDYILAIIALIFLSPLMLVVGLLIKLDSPGPMLFHQKRLGFNNKEFVVFKFRSMRHLLTTPATTVQVKPGDVRVTRIGRFIRRTSLDELPQLFNVLNGTMSLVGPRPHAIDHNEIYSKQIRGYFARHRVKPGITGWAQVNGLRGETEALEKMEARVEHDIYYADNWSLMFDFKILVMTIFVVLFSRNAR